MRTKIKDLDETKRKLEDEKNDLAQNVKELESEKVKLASKSKELEVQIKRLKAQESGAKLSTKAQENDGGYYSGINFFK